jgi:hypothetical protein
MNILIGGNDEAYKTVPNIVIAPIQEFQKYLVRRNIRMFIVI